MLSNDQIQIRAGKAVRTVRKLERPRPLRTLNDSNKIQNTESNMFQRTNSVVPDEVLQDIEAVVKHINNDNYEPSINAAIIRMCNLLRNHGMHLETKFKDQLDRYFVTFRNACREERLEKSCRLQILQIIELRAMGWRFNENLTSYYKRKIELENTMESNYNQCNVSSMVTSPPMIVNPSIIPGVPQPQATSVLGPGEITKSSGKFAKPTRIPGKNYFKDEIVIRNSDSGKVMGIKGRRVHMIEEFSDTVISFQRVSQGAKDRLVQITGSNEDSIGQAKQLIEETIRRNASPVREAPKELFGGDSCSSLNSNNSEEVGTKLNMQQQQQQHSTAQKSQLVHSLSMNDATIGEYQYTVTVGRDTIKISGSKLDIVRTAKLVLEEYFVGDAKRSKHEGEMEDLPEDAYCDQQFTSGYSDFTESFSSEMIPVQQSPASSNVPTFFECNGGYRERRLSSSSSGSDEETFKALKNVRFSDDSLALTKQVTAGSETPTTSTSAITSPCVMTVIRQPLFPDSPKEAFSQAESSHNLPTLCAKARRAKFAMNMESKDETDVITSDSPATSSPSLPKSPSVLTVDTVEDAKPDRASNEHVLMYSREFLLDCASSPLSHLPPSDLAFIKQEAPYVLKKVPERFNPVEYKKAVIGFHFFSTGRPVQEEEDDEIV